MVRSGKISKVLWQFWSPFLAELGPEVGLVGLKWSRGALSVTVKPLCVPVLQSDWEQAGKDFLHHSPLLIPISSLRSQQLFPIQNSGIGISIKSTNLNRYAGLTWEDP